MRETEQTARTVEEAVEQGLHLLGVKKDQVEVEVLDEPSGGLFGLGGKQARVRVIVRELEVEAAEKMLHGVLDILGLSAMVEVNQTEDSVRFEVLGENLGLLIGHRGQTLNALQFLVSLVLTKGLDHRKVKCVLDVEGYRVRREKALEILAQKMAKKASMDRRDVTLEPMLPHERRVIHLALENSPYVTTTSTGKEPMRRVVIKPKEGARQGGGRGPGRGPSRGNSGGFSRGPGRNDSRGRRNQGNYQRPPSRPAAVENIERPPRDPNDLPPEI